MSGITLATALASAREQLQAHSPSADADARLLLCDAADAEPTTLYAFPERALSACQQQRFESLVQRRIAGEPVAYLTGQRGFWSLDLAVAPGVLIPRAETELLVELALERCDGESKVLDLGTGSGAIALALASECPNATVTATDQSDDALDQAKRNAVQHGLNIRFLSGSWFAALPSRERFHLIVSNPPYIADTDPHLRQGDLRFEPSSALASGSDGLDDIRSIISQAQDYLRPKGWLLLEHGYDQADSVQALLRESGFENVATYKDLGGQPRVSLGQMS